MILRESLPGSGARPAKHALLQPTGKPVESNGPLSSAGPRGVYDRSASPPMSPVRWREAHTVRAQVYGAVGDAATFVVVDPHRKVVAVNEGDYDRVSTIVLICEDVTPPS